jgi:hypothetical protein
VKGNTATAEGIGQEDEAAQEEVVDHKNEKDVTNIMFNMGQFRKGDLSGGKGHDQDEGGQNIPLQQGSVAT